MTLPSRDKLRFAAKKIARGAVMLGPQSARPAIRALTYHRFGHRPGDVYTVPAADLDEQMGLLNDLDLVATPDELVAHLNGELVTSPKCVITIDDGDATTLDIAAPIFRRHRITPILFMTSGLLGVDANTHRYLNRSELRELHAAGFWIGAHGHEHVSMAKLTASDMRNDCKTAKQTLEDVLGSPVTSWAYPFGRRIDFNSATDQILLEAGYTEIFHSQHGAIDQRKLTSYPRIKVESGEPLWLFERLCLGSLDHWRFVDHYMTLFQR